MIDQSGQLVGLVFASQRIDQLIELTLHDFRQAIEGQVDTMVGDPTLREVVGTNTLAAIARTDL